MDRLSDNVEINYKSILQTTKSDVLQPVHCGLIQRMSALLKVIYDHKEEKLVNRHFALLVDACETVYLRSRDDLLATTLTQVGMLLVDVLRDLTALKPEEQTASNSVPYRTLAYSPATGPRPIVKPISHFLKRPTPPAHVGKSKTKPTPAPSTSTGGNEADRMGSSIVRVVERALKPPVVPPAKKARRVIPLHIEMPGPTDYTATMYDYSCCPLCRLDFANFFELSDHIEIVHLLPADERKFFACAGCGRAFASARLLEQHARIARIHGLTQCKNKGFVVSKILQSTRKFTPIIPPMADVPTPLHSSPLARQIAVRNIRNEPIARPSPSTIRREKETEIKEEAYEEVHLKYLKMLNE